MVILRASTTLTVPKFHAQLTFLRIQQQIVPGLSVIYAFLNLRMILFVLQMFTPVEVTECGMALPIVEEQTAALAPRAPNVDPTSFLRLASAKMDIGGMAKIALLG